MLINEPMAMQDNPILRSIGLINGNGFHVFQVNEDQLRTKATHLVFEPPMGSKPQTGCYVRGDFGSSPWLPGYQTFPDLNNGDYSSDDWLSEYGVCDNVYQVLDKLTVLHDPLRKFVVMFTPVLKKNQSDWGGWRWHKWGPYIGDHTPQCEYLYDEPEIDGVFVYHVYEWVGHVR